MRLFSIRLLQKRKKGICRDNRTATYGDSYHQQLFPVAIDLGSCVISLTDLGSYMYKPKEVCMSSTDLIGMKNI